MCAMNVCPVTLENDHVRLEPLETSHAAALVAAASDGELWNLKVTTVPSAATMSTYLATVLAERDDGTALPFVIRQKSTDQIVGSTRFLHIERKHCRVEIGATWLAASAQRTVTNTAAKSLLLGHAFEHWRCNRVELVTDVLNTASRRAIVRLGAREEGILRCHMLMPDGRIRDSVMHAIVADDWPNLKRRLHDRIKRS
jgi:RimJ/RimL family protein N-acetyltransferase